MSAKQVQLLDPVIDHRALLTRCLNKLDFAERMLMLYQGHCPTELAELDRAFADQNIESVRRIAHRLAGASANAAAPGMRARASDLRQAVDQGALDQAARCLAELHREWDKVNSAMTEFFASS